MTSITINNRKITNGQRPWIVAELSGNHQGDINIALALISAAKQAGADAVKLQTYTADTMTIDHEGPGFVLETGLWAGKNLYELYDQAHTPWHWHEQLFEHARQLDITLFSAPFDSSAVDFLESLNCPAYKIASFELVDTGLIKKVAQTGKPIIFSTGMATLEEIDEAISTAKNNGAEQIAILHCTSSYPAAFEDMHLRNIADLNSRYECATGLSDHSLGTVLPVAATAIGASIIEKHFVLSVDSNAVDAAFSLSPEVFSTMVTDCQNAWSAMQGTCYGNNQSETHEKQYRRSLYIVKDIKQGEAFNKNNIRSIRPGFGLHPRHLEEILTLKATQDIKKGTPFSWPLANRSKSLDH